MIERVPLFLVVVIGILVQLSVEVDLSFQITKSFPESPVLKEEIKLGKLVISVEQKYKEITSYINPDYPTLISESDFEHGRTVLLKFTSTNKTQHSKDYQTAVTIDNYEKSSSHNQKEKSRNSR